MNTLLLQLVENFSPRGSIAEFQIKKVPATLK